MPADYLTIEKEACPEFIERRSRFIGYIKPVTDEQQALEFINSIRAKHWDATHNVYAYVLREQNTCRYSDDNEPQGTAGMPVLDVIRKSGLTDVCVVVTRYFGGILLGGGGLVRAYSHSASLAVKAAGIIQMRSCALCTLECTYNQYGKLSSLVPENGGTVDNADFSDKVLLSFHIPANELPKLQKIITDTTCGTVEVIKDKEEYFSFKYQK
ncbi:MAG: YigZ family protein [Ruminococcus sp.]|nr:YigZ family protein [Ruminococcus sp.]